MESTTGSSHGTTISNCSVAWISNWALAIQTPSFVMGLAGDERNGGATTKMRDEVPKAEGLASRCAGEQRRFRAGSAMGRRGTVDHGADRRGHFDGFRHSRFSRPERRVDEEPRGREGVDTPELSRR